MTDKRSLETAVAACRGLMASCSPSAPASPRAANSTPAVAREVSLAVASEVVWERVLHLTGELVPAEESTLSTKVAGRLASLAVDVGTKVHQGEILARIEGRDFELRLAQAAAGLQAARAVLGMEGTAKASDIDPDQTAIVRETRAELDRARRELERQTNLVKQGAATQSTQDTASTALSAAESRWQAAKETVSMRRATLAQREVELEIAAQQLADTAIHAPYDGVVLARLAGSGDYLSVGSPLAHLLRNDPLRLRMIVPEQASGLVQPGQELRAHFDSGAPALVAQLTRFAPALGARDRTLVVEADIPNADGTLRPGSFVRAELVLDPASRTLVIPPACLVRFAGIEKVFIAEKELAVERRVKIGRTEALRIEVLEGLKAGDTLVLDPGKLQSGARLVVRAKG